VGGTGWSPLLATDLFPYMCRIQRVRMTGPLERVLRGVPGLPRHALPSGTLYPLLARLEHEHLVASAWETPQQDGRGPGSTTG
jgi:hypothetical protein